MNQPAYAKVLALTELELELGTAALKKPMSQPITADGLTSHTYNTPKHTSAPPPYIPTGPDPV